MSDDFDPLGWAEAECAHLTPAQQGQVLAFLVGIFSTYVDNPHASRISASRWRHFVQVAIADVIEDDE